MNCCVGPLAFSIFHSLRLFVYKSLTQQFIHYYHKFICHFTRHTALITCLAELITCLAALPTCEELTFPSLSNG